MLWAFLPLGVRMRLSDSSPIFRVATEYSNRLESCLFLEIAKSLAFRLPESVLIVQIVPFRELI